MFPGHVLLGHWTAQPSEDEELAFERYGLNAAARSMALYSARQHPVASAACYAAIRRSL